LSALAMRDAPTSYGAVITGLLPLATALFGAWQVICWSLVLSVPVLLPITLQHLPNSDVVITSSTLWGFLYVSMFLGFFAWYQGLMLGGIARMGQLQLFQPFLTILASALLLGEGLFVRTLGFAFGVICCMAWGKRTAIKTASIE
jgi:drug/metabolite transporter (DMT)-like permease